MAAIAFAEMLNWHFAAVAIAVVIVGVHFHRNAILGHEGAHFLISRNRLLNDLFVNTLFFWPAFATVSGYRAWHFQHHRWVGTEKDPEHIVKTGPRYSLPLSRWRLARYCILDLFGGGANEVVRLIWEIRPKRAIMMAGPALWWGVVGGLLVAAGMVHVALIIVVSLLTSFWSVYRVRGCFEHLGIDGTYRFRVGPVIGYVFFPHNTWCHFEHHRWPHLPYYSLRTARKFDGSRAVLSASGVLTLFERADALAVRR